MLIEPWDPSEKHDDFMELCRSYGLFVILTFDLKYFFQDGLEIRLL